MIRAAGVMFLTPENEALFLKRSDASDHPGEWCFPGGGIEADESAEEAAIREVAEEVGPVKYEIDNLLTRRVVDGDDLTESSDFTTFLANAKDQFVPKLNGEHTGFAWAKIDQPPEPLHPGCRIALARLGMDELGVARAMAAGDLASPQRYGTFWLFTIRLTATGLAYRDAHDEYVWRDKSLYLTDDFLARVAGLPVIFEHPSKKPKLDSEEFNDRIVGTVFLPFFRGDEVWAVTRMYDAPTVKMMRDEQVSTSSGVLFGANSGNQKFQTPEGKTLLVEGKPILWDHIAIVSNGVWDKAGPPTGVQNDLLTERNDSQTKELPQMADETEAERKAREEREDHARKDREERLDAALDSLKRMDARMDAMETEKREREDKARHDAARKDRFGHRKDGESRKDWGKRHDDDEGAMMDALVKGGCAEDKARKDAKDCRMDAEEGEAKEGGESFKKWAEEESKEPEHDKARKDAEEAEKKTEEERKDRARHDAAAATENADLKTRLARTEAIIAGLTAEVPASERDALARAQGRADSVAAMFGERAPTPTPGETSLAYRKRLLEKFKPHSTRFKASRFDSADAAILDPVEEIIYADATEAARAPANTARVGSLLPIMSRDAAGRTITKYEGDIMAMMLPFMSGATVGKINRNPKGA